MREAPPSGPYTARCVLHSATGGTGQTTAAVMLARHLAAHGHQVLLVDLDLRSSGARLMLGPGAALPRHGLVDALAAAAFDLDLVAPSAYTPAAAAGAIWVAPARGRTRPRTVQPIAEDTAPGQLANALNAGAAAVAAASGRYPDVILMDAATGRDALAEAAMCDLSDFALLFAVDTADAWATYRELFWAMLVSGQAPALREQLRVVAAMAPSVGDRVEIHRQSVLERSWDAFSVLYDDDFPDPATGRLTPGAFHPPIQDESAPHYPLPILRLPSLLGIDTTDAAVAGWHEGAFVQAAFHGFVTEAAALVTAATTSVLRQI